ncbi:hypothetical protein E4U41_003038 [Claviceps citrina]|nr:hypothetical protein E4U41_003038 [Claviceps citrina]
MPPRSPVLRRRTAPHRAAHASNVGTCITAATCRQINSHVGPLESRRRVSKRHMAGLMPTSHAPPPIWQFDVAPTTLQWEAPTSQEYRRQKRDRFSVSGLFNTFLGWLENLGSAGKPCTVTPDPPSETGLGVVRSEAEAVDSSPSTELSMPPEPEAQAQTPSTSLPEEIVQLRWSILNMKATDDDAQLFNELYQAAKACRRSLRRRIERGGLSAETLVAALEPLDAASRSRIRTEEMANKIAAMIRRGILYAMADVHNQNPAAISQDLWLAFIERQCATNGHAHDIQLFRRLLEIMPASLRGRLPAEQIRTLTCRLVAAQARRHNLFPHWLVLASRFGQALQQLSAQQRRELDDAMAAFLAQQDWDTETAKRMRYAWLVIRAHGPCASTQAFVDMYRSCLGPEHQLNALQRWHVIFARLCALRTFDAESRKGLIHQAYTSVRERWSTLLAHVMLSANKDAALQELIAVLAETGELASTVRALTSPPARGLRQDMLEALATACSNHNQALTLHDSIDTNPPASRARPLWPWTTWTKHIEAIIKDPAIDPARIWQVLKLTYTPRAIFSNKERLAQENAAKSRLLHRMALWFTQARHLTDRQALRSLQRCINMQRALSNGSASLQMLAHVVELISRDLERGQRGRTSRMEWLLAMVSEKYGAKEARRAALAWNGWRWVIDRTQGPALKSSPVARARNMDSVRV